MDDAETILYTINSIPKDIDDYARIFLNSERPDDEGELFLLINDQLIILDIQGRQIDTTLITDEMNLLKASNTTVLDTKFIYKLVCLNLKDFITQR